MKNDRLKLDHKDVIIAGVCSGFGKYFDVSTTLIRVLFILSGSIFLYLVCWLLMSEN